MKCWIAFAMVALIAFAVIRSEATAAVQDHPGALDSSFGDGGTVIAAEPSRLSESKFVAAARQPSGELVLDLRRRALDGEEVREIKMRAADGSPESSFGDGGQVVLDGGDGLVVLGSGNILVGVRGCGGEDGPGAVLELDRSGAPTAGFHGGTGCGAPLPFEPQALAADVQGRILAAGSIVRGRPPSRLSPAPTETVVARLLPDGSLDPNFGRSGLVRTLADGVSAEANMFNEAITNLAATEDGGVLFGAGPYLVRLDERGAAVRGFGNEGTVRISHHPAYFHVQSDGAIVVAAADFSGGRILVSRLRADGKPDSDFGQRGETALSVARPEVGAVASTPDGGVLVAGWGNACGLCSGEAIVARINAIGEPDPAFGGAGVLDLPLSPLEGFYGSAPQARALIVAADGSSLVAGTDRNETAFAVQLNPAGGVNPGFAAAGSLVERHLLPVQLGATGLALGPKDGLIVGTQRSDAPGLRPGFLLGFATNGEQLPGANGQGSVETLSHGRIVSNGGGQVVVWGGETKDRTLRALGPSGEPLPNYGENGVAKFPPRIKPEAVKAVPGGGVAVFGATGSGAMAVYRLDPGGRPARRFGRGGLARVSFPHVSAIAFDGLVEKSGGIVLTGSAGDGLGAARLLPNGKPDLSFGREGRFAGSDAVGDRGYLIAPWHRGVVIATTRYGSEVPPQGLIRLDRHGRLLRSFGRRGVARTAEENPALALLTGGGRIVLVIDPTRESGYRGDGVKLRAYRPGGTVDRGFGHGGLSFYGGSRKVVFEPAAAVQQEDGRIVIAGTAYSGQGPSQLELVGFR